MENTSVYEYRYSVAEAEIVKRMAKDGFELSKNLRRTYNQECV